MSVEVAGRQFSAAHAKLGLFALFGLAFVGLSLPAFLEPMTFWTGIVLGDYAYPTHELHHLVLGSVIPLLLLGVIVQAIRPANRVGALHSSIIIWLSLTVVFAIAGEFSPIHLILLGSLIGMALTHPAGSEQIPPLDDLDRRLAVIAAMTAVGAIAFAGTELISQFEAGDAHVAFGHYLFMATTGISIAALALYGSFRGIGWRWPIYGSAFLLAVIGLGSVIYPGAEQGSSLGVPLGLLITMWAIGFVAVAERINE